MVDRLAALEELLELLLVAVAARPAVGNIHNRLHNFDNLHRRHNCLDVRHL